MATNDDLKQLNIALASIGCHPLASFDAPGPAAEPPGLIYEAVRNDLLGKYPWHFTTRFAELSRKGDGQKHWRSEFHLPPERLSLPRAYYETSGSERSLKRFELFEKTVCADTDQLYSEFQVVPSAAHMPAYFLEILRLGVAAELALVIREDRVLRRELRSNLYGSEQYQGEGGQFAVATTLDSQSQASRRIDANEGPIMIAHNAGSWADDDWRGNW